MNLILGIGNLILGDDAAGPLAVRALREKLEQEHSNIHFKEFYSFGIDLLHEIAGYDRVMIIDSFRDSNLKYGEYAKFILSDLEKHEHKSLVSSHGLNLPTLWKLGEKLGFEMPGHCIVFGIAGHDYGFFYENLSREMKPVFEGIVDKLEMEALQWMN